MDSLLHVLRTLTLGSLACWLLLMGASPWLTEQVRLKGFTPVAGHSFWAALPNAAWSGHVRASAARVYEDGVPLAWGNAQHDAIRSQGRGRYSFWKDVVYIAASDNSDPRSNGRRYVARGPGRKLRSAYRGVALATVSSSILLCIALAVRSRRARRPLVSDSVRYLLGPKLLAVLSDPVRLERWISITAGGLTVAAALALVAATLDLMAPIRLSEGGPKDSRLIASILLHALLGLTFTICQVTVGGGLTLLVLRQRSVPLGKLVQFGYPLSLAWAAAAAAAAIALPAGPTIAVGMMIVAASPLGWWRPERGELIRAGRALALVLPFALSFAVFLGVLWHGPTDTLAASVMGDHVFYSSNTKAYALGLWPIAHLGVAGETQNYFALMPSLVGASLGRLGSFDPFLFFATSIPLFGLLATALGLSLLPRAGTRSGAEVSRTSLQQAAGCGLLVAGASQFPSWLVSSPPVALAAPLVVSVYAMGRAGRFRSDLAALVLAGLGTLLTKLTASPPVVVLALYRLLGRISWRRERWKAATILGFGSLATVAAIVLAVRYGPDFATIARLGPRSWQAGGLSPWLLRDAGLLLLVTGMLPTAQHATAQRATTFAVCLGALTSWLSPFVFEAAGLCAVILGACVLVDHDERPPLALGTAAGTLLCAGAVALDPSGRTAGLLLVLLVAIPCGLGVRSGPIFSGGRGILPAGALVLSLSAILALANGSLILNSGHRPEELTPAVRDIWRATRARTPPRALIFTDQTGLDTSLVGGWNTYCFHGERQVFVASVLQSRLRFDPVAQRLRLHQNERVLQGLLKPTDLPVAAGFVGWYAVVANTVTPPSSFQLCYRNASYSLYAIRQAGPGGTGGQCREVK